MKLSLKFAKERGGYKISRFRRSVVVIVPFFFPIFCFSNRILEQKVIGLLQAKLGLRPRFGWKNSGGQCVNKNEALILLTIFTYFLTGVQIVEPW